MDEILIEDKKYVSSKRAAKMTGYAKDYIGQLCREGRVPARFVGRNWYVLESAIQDHRFGTTVIEPKSSVRSAPLAREIHPTWESPRYEASTSEILPSVHRLQHAETPENLQDSWRAWFDHVGKIEPVAPMSEVPTQPVEAESVEEEKEEQYEEPKEEPKIEIEIEKDVQIPIHTIYELPPEELLPRRHMEIEPPSGPEEEAHQPKHWGNTRPRSNKGVIRTVQIAGVALAVIISFTAVIGSGYVDKYIISDNPVSILAGVRFYNK